MRKRVLRAGCLVAVGVAVGAASAWGGAPNLNLPWEHDLSVKTYTGSKVTVTYALATYTRLLLASFSHPDPSEHVDTTHVTCHGGVADVTWYTGDLEPETKKSGIHISAFMDGKEIGTLLKGGNVGVWEDGPASIRTVVPCPAGKHTFWVTFNQPNSYWGIPYANSNDRVQRGFIIKEYWS